MIGKLLCWLGFHDWVFYQRLATVRITMMQCRRCRKKISRAEKE